MQGKKYWQKTILQVLEGIQFPRFLKLFALFKLRLESAGFVALDEARESRGAKVH